MGLVKTRRLAAMQKQQKAKMSLPKPKAGSEKHLATFFETNNPSARRAKK